MAHVSVYVLTHKAFVPPPDTMYRPLHVGKALKGEDYGFPGDDTGDEISRKNIYYSELTGLYWVWKNDRDSDVVGTCHYRRYLIDEEEQLLSAERIQKDLESYDLITTKLLELNNSYTYGFGENHKPYYLEETAKVIRDLYPEDYPVYEALVRENRTYFGNMVIMKKPAYDVYCEWLFSILFTLESRIIIEEEDSYHRRIFGFISEFLLYVYVKSRGLTAKEYKVGMLQEKAEIREIRERLRAFFLSRDLHGARAYFLQCQKARPDIMMEASDITGEMHNCMEVIAIAGLEEKAYGHHLLLEINDYDRLMRYCVGLNRMTMAHLKGQVAPEEDTFMKEYPVTEVARLAAEKMFSGLAPDSFAARNIGESNASETDRRV